MNNIDSQNQNGSNGYSNNMQQDWAQQQSIPQRPVVINELEHKRDGMVATALVLGILGIVFCWIPYLSIILCLIGFIMGIINIAKTKQHTGVSIAGIIISAIGLILSILLGFLYIMLFLNF